MVLLIVDNTELPGCYSVDFLIGVDDELAVSTVVAGRQLLNGCGVVIGRVPDFKGYPLRQFVYAFGQKVEGMDGKVLLVGCLRVVTMTDIEYILRYILLHNEPRTATEPKSLALPYSVEP